jgi:hypothetical protein
VRPGAQSQAPDRHLQRPLTGIVQCTELPQHRRGDLGVIEAPLLLHLSCRCDPLAHLRRGRTGILAAQFLVRDSGDFDMQIDPIEQRPADLAQVARDDGPGAAAIVSSGSIETARTPVQISTELWSRSPVA